MGVGAQGEPGVKVPQHGGHRFYIYAILRGRGGEGVPQIVEPEMSQSGILQDFLVEIHHAVRVVHLPSEGREKQIGVSGCLSCSWMSSSTRRLGDGYQPARSFPSWAGSAPGSHPGCERTACSPRWFCLGCLHPPTAGLPVPPSVGRWPIPDRTWA